eukprot:gene27844-31458_t
MSTPSKIPTVTSAKPRIAVLLGDPSGVGPEMAVKLLARQRNLDAARVLLIADPVVLAAGERIAGARLDPLATESLDTLRFVKPVGIGDTIRVSLSAPPVEEVKVGIQILQSLNLRPRKLEIVSCPSCGRAQVDVYTLAEQVTAGLEGLEVPLRVAVMGCVVNGPGEAREADLGVASGNGKGQIFVKGEVIKTVPESQIVETLIEEAMRIAEGMEAVEGGGAQVTVS